MPWEWERRTERSFLAPGKRTWRVLWCGTEGAEDREVSWEPQGRSWEKDLWLDLNSSQQLFSDWKPSVLAFLDISSVEYLVQLLKKKKHSTRV